MSRIPVVFYLILASKTLDPLLDREKENFQVRGGRMVLQATELRTQIRQTVLRQLEVPDPKGLLGAMQLARRGSVACTLHRGRES
jgi:hypothetical protein